MLWFSLSPHLLGLAFSLSREGEARLVLSSYSSPTDLEPLAAVWEPKKGSGGNDSNKKQKKIRWGRQIFFFKKENELS